MFLRKPSCCFTLESQSNRPTSGLQLASLNVVGGLNLFWWMEQSLEAPRGLWSWTWSLCFSFTLQWFGCFRAASPAFLCLFPSPHVCPVFPPCFPSLQVCSHFCFFLFFFPWTFLCLLFVVWMSYCRLFDFGHQCLCVYVWALRGCTLTYLVLFFGNFYTQLYFNYWGHS